MAINIKAGSGSNFANFLKSFNAEFEASGYGQFSGDDGMSGKEYAATDANGDGVIFTADETDWAYDFITHTVSGSLDAVTFGDSVELDDGSFTSDVAFKISNLNINDSDTAEGFRESLTDGDTSSFLALLKESNLNYTGAAKKDVFQGYSGKDKILGNGGNDTLKGGGGGDTVNGGKGSDTLYGQAGADKLLGGADADTLLGGNGGDTLDGGAGKDTLTGGSGDDTFVFKKGYGNDTITDFDGGQGKGDVISFTKGLFDSFADVEAAATEVGGDTVIDYGNGSLTLKDFALDDLHKSDFLFA
ncbi:calcium-binding protein [Rhizobium sp. TRM95111]|uniref:calcium-binding protein n=1 Tax=Rhizobium alarense TaxID=2846851 RepID=UPI001F3E7278|nr:calcium-binding protein [Rhizobium alarense]MCF3638498.1 calcium-binding protein [Rhizobium alarense]